MRKYLWLIAFESSFLLWHGMPLPAVLCAGLGTALIELLEWARKQEARK